MTMLTKRAQSLLRVLITHYVASGQPVASKSVAEDSTVSLSAATVRKVLAELEEQGYVASPHTSAGRVPTALGYRFLVDGLLKVRALNACNIAEFQSKLETSTGTSDLIQSASSLLSQLSNFAGIVTFPKRNRVLLRHVEFLPLSENRVLSILVLNTAEVENRIINMPRAYSKSELEQASNYINQHYSGKSLLGLRAELLLSMQQDKDQLNQLLQTALDIFEKTTVKTQEAENYVLEGQSNLLDFSEPKNAYAVKALFDAFSHKGQILELLDHCLQSEGMQIYIGGESGNKVFGQHSLIMSSYSVGGQVVGVLGVVGPTRMHYERVISIVDVTSKLLSSALNDY